MFLRNLKCSEITFLSYYQLTRSGKGKNIYRGREREKPQELDLKIWMKFRIRKLRDRKCGSFGIGSVGASDRKV